MFFHGKSKLEEKSILLLAGQDVLLVLALVVAWGIIVADVDSPVGSRAELLGASDRLGVLPDDLGEVTGGHRETGVLVVVLADLIVPGIDTGLEVLVTSSQVLTVLSTAVLELTSLDPVITKGSSLGVPLQGLGTVAGTVLVVGIEDGLLLGSRENTLGLDATLLEVDVVARDGVVALGLVKGESDGFKLDGRGADLGGGRGSKDRNGGDKEGSELDHDVGVFVSEGEREDFS